MMIKESKTPIPFLARILGVNGFVERALKEADQRTQYFFPSFDIRKKVNIAIEEKCKKRKIPYSGVTEWNSAQPSFSCTIRPGGPNVVRVSAPASGDYPGIRSIHLCYLKDINQGSKRVSQCTHNPPLPIILQDPLLNVTPRRLGPIHKRFSPIILA